MSTLVIMRRTLLALLLFGLAGTLVELLLLRHTEGLWQIVPVALIALALATAIWCAVRPGRIAIRSLQLLMWLFLLSGVAGTVLHFLGNIAYERDSNPSLSGLELYLSALQGSTPSLAPGTMFLLGLVGLLHAFRHPGLGRGSAPGESSSEGTSP